jgi:putative transport protein
MNKKQTQKVAYLSTFFSLYIAQAVPMSFFTTALQVIMREQAVSLSIIGLLQIIKLPWILKVFWSPAIDRYCNTVRDYKRAIIGAEITYALLIFITSLFDLHTILPSYFHILIAIILLALAASATQDIATDALAIRTSTTKQRGLLNSMQSMGSFGGSLLGSGVLLMVFHSYGWNSVTQCLSIFVLIALVPLLLHKKLSFQQETQTKQRATWKDFVLFFTQKGIARQIVFLVLYYTGIIGIMSILKPFMVDLGYSMKEIGFICGIIGIGAAFVMAYPAGILVRRYGYQRMRSVFAFIMFLATLIFVFLSINQNFTTTLTLTIAIVVLWGSYGMGTVVVYTSSMKHVRVGREGTDFTVQTVITHLMGIIIAVIGGVIAHYVGYAGMFATQSAIALASFFYTLQMNKTVK